MDSNSLSCVWCKQSSDWASQSWCYDCFLSKLFSILSSNLKRCLHTLLSKVNWNVKSELGINLGAILFKLDIFCLSLDFVGALDSKRKYKRPTKAKSKARDWGIQILIFFHNNLIIRYVLIFYWLKFFYLYRLHVC